MTLAVEEIHGGVLEVAADGVALEAALGQAVNYTLNQWPKLKRCFEYPGGRVVEQPGRRTRCGLSQSVVRTAGCT